MAKDILETIKEYTLERVEKASSILPIESVIELAKESQSGKRKFYNALAKSGVSLICEIKKASPSKGIIDSEFNYMQILSDYENGGADALSVLTEPKFFLGGNHIFNEVRQKTNLPMLRKDFVATEYQIYESKALGADAILLICAMLDAPTLKKFYALAKGLELDVLVETHNELELEMALEIDADIIGVNSRNLKTFDVSLSGGVALIGQYSGKSEGKLFVLESGIESVKDIESAKDKLANAVLVGETLMRSDSRVELLESFKKAGI